MNRHRFYTFENKYDSDVQVWIDIHDLTPETTNEQADQMAWEKLNAYIREGGKWLINSIEDGECA